MAVFEDRFKPEMSVSCQQMPYMCVCNHMGVRCSSVVRAFAHGAMGRRIELFLVPASAPRLV